MIEIPYWVLVAIPLGSIVACVLAAKAGYLKGEYDGRKGAYERGFDIGLAHGRMVGEMNARLKQSADEMIAKIKEAVFHDPLPGLVKPQPELDGDEW